MKYFFVLAAFAVYVATLAGCTHMIAISTDPPEASVKLVEVNGENTFELGPSPVKATVTAAGDYMIIIEKPGYASLRKKINLGTADNYDFKLVPVYEFYISTEPEGAKIVLEDTGADNIYNLGRAPLKHVIESEGPFTVKASMAGYETAVVEADTVPGKSAVQMEIQLIRK